MPMTDSMADDPREEPSVDVKEETRQELSCETGYHRT